MSSKHRAPILSNQVQQQIVQNLMLERKMWLSRLLDPRRDIDKECGHPEVVTIQDYVRLFKRGDIAARVVSLYPEESWSELPQIYENEDAGETEFEKAWKLLEEEKSILAVMQRADILSGIGRYGAILLGFDDGQPLNMPLPGIDDNGNFTESPRSLKLIYLRVFDESCINVGALEGNVNNPRYGQPKSYSINFQDTSTLSSTATVASEVHWSRIIHLADNRMASEIYGQPRMEKVLNRILDLAKVAGGSGEMFWKGGFPGVSLETTPEALAGGTPDIDLKSTRAQLDAYMNGLQRYLATVGMSAKSLAVEIADPTPHIDAQIKLISVAMSVPWRIFAGSEAAQLASEQDYKAWNRRLARRRHEYLNPYVIKPFLERLIAAGTLPKPAHIYIDWPDLSTPSDKDKGTVAESRANSLAKYVATGADQLMPPYHFFTLCLGYTDEEALSILDASIEELEKVDGGAQDLLGNPNDPRKPNLRMRLPTSPQGTMKTPSAADKTVPPAKPNTPAKP